MIDTVLGERSNRCLIWEKADLIGDHGREWQWVNVGSMVENSDGQGGVKVKDGFTLLHLFSYICCN